MSPLFSGETDIDQLHRVLAVRGTPDVWISGWPEVKQAPDFDKISFVDMPAMSLAPLLGNASSEAMSLADSMLQVPPRWRTSAADALSHAWFIVSPAPAHLGRFRLPDDRVKRTAADYDTGSAQEIMAAAMALE